MAVSPTPAPTAPRDPWSRRHRRRRWPLVALGLFGVIALFGATVVYLVGRDSDTPDRPRFTVPALDVDPGTTPPVAVPLADSADLVAWAGRVSAATDIPRRTLLSYARAELRTRDRTPACGLTWTTLAAIGRVESHHGRYGGTSIGEDGNLSKPIIGVPLDGSPGVQAIPDTDKGSLDGDPAWDRALGSMQFLPTTWARWSVRATPDSAPANPQNVDDASLTAARYLCASGGNLTTGQGWWKAVLTYNESTKYGRDVFSGAAAYAAKSQELN